MNDQTQIVILVISLIIFGLLLYLIIALICAIFEIRNNTKKTAQLQEEANQILKESRILLSNIDDKHK
jgi:cytoskeletal protein RodZ